jgi:hypothetical protein
MEFLLGWCGGGPGHSIGKQVNIRGGPKEGKGGKFFW